MHAVRRMALLGMVLSGFPMMAQSIFNCSSGWVDGGGQAAGSNKCAVATVGNQPSNWALSGSNVSSVSGTRVLLIPAGDSHDANSLTYQTPVNVQAFTFSFQYIPNGQYFSAALNNNNNSSDGSASHLIGGAGGESDIFQGYGGSNTNPSPDNIWAIQFDSYSPLNNSGSTTYSDFQMYETNEAPYIPARAAGGGYINGWNTNKISTSPVSLVTANTPGTATGHIYSVTITYTGTNLFLSMYDVTAGGSCPGASCVTHNWPVNIPSIVGGTKAYFGIMSSTGSPTSIAAYAVGASFTQLGAAAAPSFSLAGGTYGSAQSVALSSSSPGAIVCYNNTGAPATNGAGSCQPGSNLYSGSVSVSGSETIFAVAGGAGYGDSAITSTTYQIGATPAQPTFFPGGQTYYQGNQTVYLSTANGDAIYYNTTGSPTCGSTLYSNGITVSSNETIYAVSCLSGTPSAVSSVTYSINPFWTGVNNTPEPANSPTFSVAPGTYAGTQSVSLASTTSGAYICYAVSITVPTIFPQTDNRGGCAQGTAYTGPITVSSSKTIYAMAGLTYAGPPSSLSSGTYTITSGSTPTATPTFSPGAGTYTGTVSVSIADSTSGASSYYTTDGTTPTTSSTPYTGPIAVSSTMTLKAMALAAGDTSSAIASANYAINPPLVVATPALSPAGGTYTSAQSVTISDSTPGATIYYTTNGSTPTTSSTPYTGPITVSATETLQAMAAATGDTNSSVASATYTITPVVATPTFSLAAGTYTSTQSVSLSDATSGATIYYTTNGSTPTTSSTPYTGPITVSATETLQAMAAATGDTNSSVASATYTITPVVATPTFSLAAGTYTSTQSVSLSDATSGATIYYTTNGSTPTTSSTPYTGPITVSATETLQAMAAATGDTNSSVASATYTITPVVATPTFSLAAGTYTSTQSVNLSDVTSGATIYYTTNGSTPTTSSTPYTGPITVSATETLAAMAAATGDTNSSVASATYTITPVVATPTFSLAAGTYTSTQSVSLSDATSGATIYYTTNGSTPTTASTAYTGPITVSSTETLQAIAAAAGDTNSAVASATYTITPVLATPVFLPAAGTFTTAQSVTLSDATSGATIYYTTNGSTPTTASTAYTGPITVSSTETLQAIAAAAGDTNSAVASATYTITPVVATPVFLPAAGTFTTAQSVTLSDATSGATIYYTTNGSTPTTASTAYTGPITVSSTETLQAIAAAAGEH